MFYIIDYIVNNITLKKIKELLPNVLVIQGNVHKLPRKSLI